MASSGSSGEAGHVIVGVIGASVSHYLVPIRNWVDYLVRAIVGALFSAAAFAFLRLA